MPVRSTTALAVLLAAATAQKPEPAADRLEEFAPLIGSWRGAVFLSVELGKLPTATVHSTYAWALGGFFVQCDGVLSNPRWSSPLVWRRYLGWDAEQRCGVAVSIDSRGAVGVHQVESFMGSQTVHQIASGGGQSYAERYTTVVDGDRMTWRWDYLFAPFVPSESLQVSMTRSDEPANPAMDVGAAGTAPAAMIARLGRIAGTHAFEATMVAKPGGPARTVTGTDEVRPVFGGTIVHVHTSGRVEGMSDAYERELFYSYDELRDCIRAVYVSNLGEVGEMEGAFDEHGGSLVLTGSMPYLGKPCAQRMVLELGADGAPIRVVGHRLLGTEAPFENWNATYTRK